MLRKLVTIICCLTCFVRVSAQYTLQGKVLDKVNEGAVEMATVRMLRAQDSMMVNGTVTDFAGRFSFNKVSNGNYIIEVKYLTYKTQFVNVEIKGKSRILNNIMMEEDVKMLKEAEVSGMAAQMIVKGDTVEYNAGAFKLQEDAVVEDLFKRLPGFVVDVDGNITVNGESISRIRVDGKKFFDGDIEMVTKNLTADMIDKVQVIDEKSEMAQLTGVEDGETKRIINLKIKPDRNKGTFGNLGGGLGADYDKGFKDYVSPTYRNSNYRSEPYDRWIDKFIDEDARYNANTMINWFNKDIRTSLTAGANNANGSRSSRGAGNRGWSGGSGITSTQNIGVNNSMSFKGDSVDMSGHITYNHSTNQGRSSSKTESWLRDVTSADTSFSRSYSVSNNASLNYDLHWKLDTLNTLVIQPNLSYGFNSSHSDRTFEYYTNGDTTSWGNSANDNSSRNVNAGLTVMFSHKSGKKQGRTLTGNLRGNFSNSKGEGTNISNKYMPGDSADIRNQRNKNRSDNYSLSFRGSFVEPLWNIYNVIEFNGSVNYSNRSSVRDQYDYDELTGEWTSWNEEYSNETWNRSLSEDLSLNYNYRGTNLNLTAGMTAQPSQSYSYTLYGDGTVRDIPNSVFNYSPSLNVRWNLGGNRREYVRVEYRGRSSEPSIQQMQPVKNNTNAMRETVGNPYLLPSFAHTMRLQYSKSNQVTFASFSTSLNATVTKDALVSNSIYDASGKQYSQTVNAERDPFNLNGSVMYNRPIIQNRLHLNTNTSASYQQRIGYSSRNVALENIDPNDIIDGKLVLGDRSITDNYSVSENLSLTLTHDIIEVGARGQFRYSNTLNNLNTSTGNRSTINWSTSGNVTLHLPYNINIDNNLSFNARQGYAGFDRNELLWNASINAPVFKKKFTLQLSANDILRQRQNINQNIGDNSVSYSQSDMLTSYFMLSLTYRVRRFGGRPGGRGQGMNQGSRARRDVIAEANSTMGSDDSESAAANGDNGNSFQAPAEMPTGNMNGGRMGGSRGGNMGGGGFNGGGFGGGAPGGMGGGRGF